MTMSTPDQIAEEMREATELFERTENKPSPFRDEITHLLGATGDVEDTVNLIVGRWKTEYLAPSVAHDKDQPNAGQDYENYSRPLIVPTEILRHSGFNELA